MDSRFRILSLLPAATEIVYLLGLEKYLVGVSHECDYPLEVKKIPKVTFSEVSNSMTSREIDDKVKKSEHRGIGINHLKNGILEKLKPNLILAQELCEVCAIGFNEVKKAARILDGDVKIISFEPESVEDILENILLVGEVTGSRRLAGKVVGKLMNRLRIVSSRLARLARLVSRRSGRESKRASARSNKKLQVLVIEWLDPIMLAGHWVPEMVELAGGINLGVRKRERSKKITYNQLKQFKPDILIISPCGFDIDKIKSEKEKVKRVVGAVKSLKGAYLVDGNAYMTRPGPRVVDGIEILSEILHPDIFPRRHSEKDWIQLN